MAIFPRFSVQTLRKQRILLCFFFRAKKCKRLGYDERSNIYLFNFRAGAARATPSPNSKKTGYTDVVQIQNASGHGVDIIARNPDTGEVKVMEVKTTTVGASAKLSSAQKAGGKAYTESRLEEALGGNYGSQAEADALKAQQWMKQAGPNNTRFEVQQVLLTQGDGGVVAAKLGINKPWGASS